MNVQIGLVFGAMSQLNFDYEEDFEKAQELVTGLVNEGIKSLEAACYNVASLFFVGFLIGLCTRKPWSSFWVSKSSEIPDLVEYACTLMDEKIGTVELRELDRMDLEFHLRLFLNGMPEDSYNYFSLLTKVSDTQLSRQIEKGPVSNNEDRLTTSKTLLPLDRITISNL